MLAAVMIVWITMARPDADIRLQRLLYLTVIESVLGLIYVTLGNIFEPEEFHEYLLYYPGLFAYSWSSPLIYANTVSQLGALVGLFCLARTFESKAWRGSLGWISSYLTAAAFPVLSQGRTGMISLVIGTSFILVRRFRTSSAFIIPVIAGLMITLFGDTLLRLFVRGEDKEMLLSLSGRTTLWEFGWHSFLDRPWLGFGWGAGSRAVLLKLLDELPGEGFGGNIASLHNGLLEVLLGVGLVGFVVWAWAVVWSLWLTVVAYFRGERLSSIVGMVVFITATILSLGVGGWLDFFVQQFLAMSALLWVRARFESGRVRATRRTVAAEPAEWPL
jgi:O-antigen ligase